MSIKTMFHSFFVLLPALLIISLIVMSNWENEMGSHEQHIEQLNEQFEVLNKLNTMNLSLFFNINRYLNSALSEQTFISIKQQLISSKVSLDALQSKIANYPEQSDLISAFNAYVVMQSVYEAFDTTKASAQNTALLEVHQQTTRAINTALTSTKKQLQNAKQQLHDGSSNLLFYLWVSLISLLLFALFIFYYLNKRLITPFTLLHRAFCIDKNYNGRSISLPAELSGEVADIVQAVSKTYQKLDERADTAKIRHAFSEDIRHCNSPNQMRTVAANFLAEHFYSPSVAIYRYEDDHFIQQSLVGFAAYFDEHSIQVKKLVSDQTAQAFISDGQNAVLHKDGLTLEVHTILYIPLVINEELSGAVVITFTSPPKEVQNQCLKLLCEDLSIQLRLSENSQKQVEAENALAAHLELTLHIINAIPNPTYYRDKKGIFMGVNRAFLAFIDKFEVEVTDSHLNDVFDQRTATYLDAKSQRTIEEKDAHSFALAMENSLNEHRELVVYEAPFFDSAGEVGGVVGTFLDVTERNELERQMLTAKEEADKNAQIKGEFLANMSHEIRSPMNAIIGMAHLAINSNLNPKQLGYVTKIDYAAKQLLKLINDILDFSKIEAGKVEIEHIPYELDKVLDNVTTIVGLKAQEKQLDLVFNVPTDMPNNFIGDPLRLSQILINLAGNAVKFTETGGVTLTITLLDMQSDQVKLTFSVKDTGIGMSAEQQTKLFQSFSQADTSTTRKYGGTGLGLTISQQLVKLLGGEIFVESELGCGSQFYFTLPMEINNYASKSVEKSHTFSGKKACVIDDNEDARDILETMLESLGFEVTLYESGKHFIDKLSPSTSRYDIMFVDWHMPNINGIDTIEYLKQSGLQNYFVLVTAHGHEVGFKEAHQSMIDSMLFKPFNPSSLLDCLQECFGASTVSQATKKPVDNQQALKDLKILVAEDQPVNQEIAVEILSFHGAQVSVACNGEMALKAVQDNQFDIVLMDMQMPVMDGVEATKEIRQSIPNTHLPILAMTANAMGPDIQLCLDAGMNGHVAKPIDVDGLISSILEALTLQTSNTPEIEVEDIPEHSEKDIDIVLTGINIEEGVERAANNEAIYFKLLNKFISQQVEEVINLQQSISMGNMELALDILHAMKGAGANLSMDYFSEVAADIEEQVKADNIDLALLETLADYISDTKNKATLLLHRSHSPSKQTQSFSIGEFAQALKEYDSKATDMVEQLEANEALDDKTIKELKVMISRFEFSEAYNLLQNTVGELESE
ncbi:PAS domain-containing hybrid sensor histidine kinase/response regulator [Pseudoalteromonas luteoviolacea]|nr:PAS domain-containing hybrid sensor histidine kinase/response regulator [Pseudoalteromonas luteoviolacea]MBQ4876502.1 response regulator [Pseudoalteromonas luteoviolacea]MBQ4905133.1 response regulator [Pseudoalteromonas luteoviolacea]